MAATASSIPIVPSVHPTEGRKLARWAFFSLLAAAIPMAIAGEVGSGYLWALAAGCSAVAFYAVHTVSPELARERYHPPSPGLDGTTLFWVRPVIPELPSVYFRRNCFATYQQDEVGLMFVEELDLVDNMMWANDYPHHEGVWPHSAASIERTMGHLTDESRAKILGLNAARVFGLEVPVGKV